MFISAITFFVFAFLHDHDVAIFVAKINLAVDQHRRTPNGGEEIVCPVNLSCLRIESSAGSR